MEYSPTQSVSATQPYPALSAPPPPQKSSPSWFKVLLFIVLMGLLAAGAVYGGMKIGEYQSSNPEVVMLTPTAIPDQVEMTPSPDVSPTATPATASPAAAIPANWKTYTDTANGYTFQYPPTFAQIPYTEGESKGVQVSSTTAGQSLSDGAMVKTTVVATSSAQLLAQQLRRVDSTSDQTETSVTGLETTMLSGKPTYSYLISSMGGMVKVVFIQLSDKTVLKIAGYYAGTEPKLSTYQQQIDQIISSFKLTE